MPKYCVHLEHHGNVWLIRIFGEDRFQELATKTFASREAYADALQSIGMPITAVNQLEADAAEGRKATIEIELAETGDFAGLD